MLSLPSSPAGCALQRASAAALAFACAITTAAGRRPACRGRTLHKATCSNSVVVSFLQSYPRDSSHVFSLSSHSRRRVSIAWDRSLLEPSARKSLTAQRAHDRKLAGGDVGANPGEVTPRFSGGRTEERRVTPTKVAGQQLSTKGALVGEERRAAVTDEDGVYRLYQDLREGKKTRFVSRVMYDGTNYSGFQLQNNGQPTIQEVLEMTLSRRFQRYVPVLAAGRTDSGVHATGQAVQFDLDDANTDLNKLTYVMNQMMPEDVRVWNMSKAPRCSPEQAEESMPWHVMVNAKGKTYTYRLFVGKVLNPLERFYRVHANQAAKSPINAELIYQVMPLFVGKHNFAAFCNDVEKTAAQTSAGGFGDLDTWREVYAADVIDEGGGSIKLVFHLNGALYRMIRNMVGAVLAVAAGRTKTEAVSEMLKTGVRGNTKMDCAPAHGLTLENVFFDGYE